MKYIIIGTAGHVDHGKTALIKALTGKDTDRLKEEKTRGISIDLGFAALDMGDEITAGIVDVPGHERFLKNMLAGTGGIDMAMLVIAADEGVMPQTREHLAMLELFGVRRGVVVLNKIDKTDTDWRELVLEDVKQFLVGTFLAEAPLCQVSAVSGAGLDYLRRILLATAREITARDTLAPFRLWIDRVFTVKGHGVVATGSVLSGNVEVGETLAAYTAGSLLRVRGLESHGQKVDRIYAGQRAAINLGGGSTEELQRGRVLSSTTRGVTSNIWDVEARWQQEAASGARVRLHLGTGEFIGRIYHFQKQTADYVRLILEKPLTAGMGDKGIIRQYSPQYLLGGVTIIAPGKKTRKVSATRIQLAKALNEQNIDETIYCLVADNDQPETSEDLKRQAGYLNDKFVEDALARLVAEKRIIVISNYFLTATLLDNLTQQLTALVVEYHREQPDLAGLSKDILRQKLRLKERVFEVLLDFWQEEGLIGIRAAEVALKEFAVRHSDWRQNLVKKTQACLDDIGLTPVDWQLLAEKLTLPPDKARSAHSILLREGVIVRIGDMQIYRGTIQNILNILRQRFAANQTITVSELRDILGTSRKVAVPLLEYFDLQKYTIREGDIRRAGPKLSAFLNND